MRNLSIKYKLVLMTLTASAVIVFFTALSFGVYDRYSFRQRTLHSLHIQAQMVGANSEAALSFGYESDAADMLSALKADRSIEAAAIYDKNGKLFARYSTPMTQVKLLQTFDAHASASDNQYLRVVEPIVFRREQVGTLLIVSNMSVLVRRQHSYLVIMCVLIGASMLLSAGVSLRLQRVVSVPLTNLARTMSQIASDKDYGVRVSKASEDEIGQLVGTFNEMLEEIEQRDHELEERVARRTEALRSEVIERKRAEDEARSLAEAAQAANKAKSQFLANMSHEIRTPMNGVLGVAELLEMTELTEEQREYTQMIATSGAALLAIINDILDISKAEAGKLRLQPEEFSMTELVDEIGDSFSAQAREKGLELICNADPAIPTLLIGDRGRLRQVLVNLVGNALKFTREGEVSLEVRQTASDGKQATIDVSVRDTGIGIADADKDHVFDSFTQADGSNTRQHGGTGLGLTICRQIVELMGGHIVLESELGQGSAFRFAVELPISASASVAETTQPFSVLVVDDNATNRRVIQEQLSARGCVVDLADSGESAIRILKSKAFHVVVLDMQMPGLTGEDTALKIQGLGVRTPLVLLSSVGSHWTPDELAAKGFFAALSKPMKGSRLFSVLALAVGAREISLAA